jgi:hypothetical protein
MELTQSQLLNKNIFEYSIKPPNMGVFCYIYLTQVFINMGKKIKVRLTEQELIDLITKQLTGQDSFSMLKDLLSGKVKDIAGKIADIPLVSGNRDADVKEISTDDDEFYKKILSCVGAQPTKDNMAFMYAWRQSEGGTANNNPFNTTHKMPNSTRYKKNTHGVQNYKTPEDGIRATCNTIKNGRYNDIVDGLKNDVGLFELSRMKSLNVWGTGPLLAKVVDGYLKGATPKPQDIA